RSARAAADGGRGGRLSALARRAPDRLQPPGDRRLLVGGLVLVDDALAGRLVQLAGGVPRQRRGQLVVPGLQRGVELADRRLQRRLDRFVPQPALLVLPDALDL